MSLIQGTVTQRTAYYRSFMSVVESEVNTANNTSKVTVQVLIDTNSTSYNFSGAVTGAYVYINGVKSTFSTFTASTTDGWTYNTSTSPTGRSAELFMTATGIVTHDASGSKTCSVSAYCSAAIGGYGPGTVNISGSVTLTSINRVSTFTAGNANINSDTTINITRSSTSLTHTLKYSCGTATGTISTGVATSYTWKVPLSLYSQLGVDTSKSCTLTCETYDGATLVGTKTGTIVIYEVAVTNITTFTATPNPCTLAGTITLTWSGATAPADTTITGYLVYAQKYTEGVWGAYSLVTTVDALTYAHVVKDTFPDITNSDQVRYKIVTKNNYDRLSSGIVLSTLITMLTTNTLMEGRQGWAVIKDYNGDFFKGAFDKTTIKMFRADHIKQTIPITGNVISKYYPVWTVLDNTLFAFITPSDPTRTYNSATQTYGNFYLPESFALSKLTFKKTTTASVPDHVNPNFGDVSITAVPITIKSPSISEAMSAGFNMLKENLYSFPNLTGSTSADGVIPYTVGDPFGDVKYTASIGETVRFNFVYHYETGVTYYVKWEYQADGGEVKVLQDYTAIASSGASVYKDLIMTDSKFTITAYLRRGTDDSTTQLMPLYYILDIEALKNTSNDDFTLSTGTGMFTFNDMLGVYGVRYAENAIFFSDISNPSYFPFPHNVTWVDDKILNVVSYLDMILVITNKSLTLISGKGAVSDLTQKKILDNLNITALDARNIQTIKDQLFIKSGTSYYVLKPNAYSSDGTDLRNYEISKSVAPLMADLRAMVVYIMDLLYKKTVLKADVLLIDEVVQVIDGKLYLYFPFDVIVDDVHETYTPCFTYDPLTRAWFLHWYTTKNVHTIQYHFKEESNILTYLYPYNNEDGTMSSVQAVTQEAGLGQYQDYITINGVTYQKNNIQAIDTGVVPLQNVLYKRLRELQFTVHNSGEDVLEFYINVYADDRSVVGTTTYATMNVTDPTDPNYGLIYVTETDNINLTDDAALHIYSTTVLDTWEIDFSKYPGTNLIRTHLKLVGTGRYISATIVNKSEKEYELSNIAWVFRAQNAR